MFKRFAAITAIFVCATAAWAVLGSTIFYRTYNAESGLSGRVASTWGAPQEQVPPTIRREWWEEKTVEVEEKGKKTTKKENYLRSEPAKIEGSRITAALHVDYRQKGLLWFSTYKVDFEGAYAFQNPRPSEEEFAIALPFPAQQAVYDSVQLRLDDKPLPLTFSGWQAEQKRCCARNTARRDWIAGAIRFRARTGRSRVRATMAYRATEQSRKRAIFTCW